MHCQQQYFWVLCGHQPPWNRYRENKPVLPELLFCSNTNLWSELFITVPLPHLLHILSCATWEHDWGKGGWLHLEAGTTCYLPRRAEKLIACIKWLLLFTRFSFHTASGGQEGDKFSPVREVSNRIHTSKHPLHGPLVFMALQQGCMSLLYYRSTLTDGLRYSIVITESTCTERPKLLQFSVGSGKVQFVCRGHSCSGEDNSPKAHVAFILTPLGWRQVLALTDHWCCAFFNGWAKLIGSAVSKWSAVCKEMHLHLVNVQIKK